MKKLHDKQGFTIIELMIATMVFAVILILCTTGLLQVGRMYYKGVTMTRTQEAARVIAEEISQNIQFSGGTVSVAPGSVNKLCIGRYRYSYVLGRELGGATTNEHVLVVDSEEANCISAAAQQVDVAGFVPTDSSRELMGLRMRISQLSVQSVGNNLYDVTVRVVHGDDDVLEDLQAADGSDGTDGVLDTCRNARLTSQFCAVAELQTTVQKRLNQD